MEDFIEEIEFDDDYIEGSIAPDEFYEEMIESCFLPLDNSAFTTPKEEDNTPYVHRPDLYSTIISDEKIRCPHCEEESVYQRFSCINVLLEPELKENVDNNELFTWICPNCENKYFLKYPFVYYDGEQYKGECLCFHNT